MLRDMLRDIFYLMYKLRFIKLRKRLIMPPIMIGGCARSGTTLLLSILSAHPKIYAIDKETRVFCPTTYYDIDLNARFNINKLYRYYRYFNKKVSSCDRWCEKTAKNVIFFGKILKYFNNNVKLIHIVRDGRDVILSKHPGINLKFYVSPERWIEDVKAGLKYEKHSQVYTVKYEDLILNYKKTIRDLCNFLNIKCNEFILNWYKYATVRKSHDWLGVEVKPLYNKSIGKWKNPKYKERIKNFMKNPEVVRLLRHFNYIN